MIEVAVIALTVALVACVFVAVTSFRTLTATIQLVDRVHVRGQVHLSDALDRLMAVDFESYRAWRASDTAEEGGFFTREDQKAEVKEPNEPRRPRWGGLTSQPEDVTEVLEDLDVPDERLPPPQEG